MASIDTRNRKPRKAFGTPLFKLRYYLAGGLGLYSLIFGTILATSPYLRDTRESMDIGLEIRRENLERQSDVRYSLEQQMDNLHKFLKPRYKNPENTTTKKEQ